MNIKIKCCCAVFMIFVLAANITGCSSAVNSEQSRTGDDKISIVTTIFPPYDFAKAIGGDKVEVTMLLAPGVESHSYEPTPQDIIKINKSDLFIYVGGESDAWVDGIMDSLDQKVQTMTLMDCVEAVAEEQVEGMETTEEESHGEQEAEEPEYDEHVWTSPRNASLIQQRLQMPYA